MANIDPYRGFAARYSTLRHESPERTAFFKTLFDSDGVRRILDCACGTGEDLLLFSSLGVDVAGSDLSEAMLALAKEKLAAAGVEVPLVRTDFRELPKHFDEPFDAAVCLSTSLPHLHEDEEILKALDSMRSVLREGGLLVLDQGMTDRQWAEKPHFIPAVNTAEFCRLMAIDYSDEEFTVHVIDFADDGGERAFHHDIFVYRRLLRDDYANLLREAGFRAPRFYGGFSFEPYSKTGSRRLIVVAER